MEYNIRFTLDVDLKQNFLESIKYHFHSDYFYSIDDEIKQKYKYRFDNIKKGEQLGNTGMNILEIPARKLTNTTKKEKDIKCPLCVSLQVDNAVYPFNLEKELLWRGYLIRPNAFPYFKLHYLIQSSDHNENIDIVTDKSDIQSQKSDLYSPLRGTQNEVHKNPNLIEDMLIFLKIINKGSLLFNGWIGNSLSHMHFHYTDMDFPIKKKLKIYLYDKDVIKTNNKSKINIYKDNEHNCKNFLFVKGKNPGKDVFQILQYLSSINLLYNLLIYLKNNTYYVFIYIRKKDQDDLRLNFGATNMSGLTTLSNNNFKLYEENKKKFLDNIEDYCSKTVIKIDPNEIKNLFS